MLGAGDGSAGAADAVIKVEIGVIDPQRPPGLQGRGGELLSVSRHEVQPAADMVEVVLELRRRALEHEHPTDVHALDAGPS